MAFHVNLERKAEINVASAERFLLRIGRTTLEKWRSRFVHAIKQLETTPHRFPEAAEATELSLDLRELNFNRYPHIYRVLFTIEGDTVHIHAIRHAAQDRLTEDDI